MSDKVICHCTNTTEKEIIDAIKDGNNTLDLVMAMTPAGTVCGGCQSEILEIIEKNK